MSSLSMQLLVSELLNLESSTKATSSSRYVYWIEIKEFICHVAFKNSQRQEGTGHFSYLKAESRDWETKIVKMRGEYKYVQFVFLQYYKRWFAGDGLSYLHTSYPVSTRITVIPKNNCEFECRNYIIYK